MKLKNIILALLLTPFQGCHAPLLLSILRPENQPKEKYSYYEKGFSLEPGSMLRTDGFYYAVSNPTAVTLTLERYEEAKEKGQSPYGLDLDKIRIVNDTVLMVVHTSVYIFYPNGTFSYGVYSNRSQEEMFTLVGQVFRDKEEGRDVYKIKGQKIYYEYYDRMSAFRYNEGYIGENTITVGESRLYRFTSF